MKCPDCGSKNITKVKLSPTITKAFCLVCGYGCLDSELIKDTQISRREGDAHIG